MKTTKVKVTAYSNVREYLGWSESTIEMASGSSVSDLLQVLKKPDKETWLVSVNNVIVSENKLLREGDEIKVFEGVGGG